MMANQDDFGLSEGRNSKSQEQKKRIRQPE